MGLGHLCGSGRNSMTGAHEMGTIMDVSDAKTMAQATSEGTHVCKWLQRTMEPSTAWDKCHRAGAPETTADAFGTWAPCTGRFAGLLREDDPEELESTQKRRDVLVCVKSYAGSAGAQMVLLLLEKVHLENGEPKASKWVVW